MPTGVKRTGVLVYHSSCSELDLSLHLELSWLLLCIPDPPISIPAPYPALGLQGCVQTNPASCVCAKDLNSGFYDFMVDLLIY